MVATWKSYPYECVGCEENCIISSKQMAAYFLNEPSPLCNRGLVDIYDRETGEEVLVEKEGIER